MCLKWHYRSRVRNCRDCMSKQKCTHTCKRCASCCSIGQGNTIEQEGRGERTEQEILHARFLGSLATCDETTQDVQGQREHFQAKKNHEEAHCCCQEHHADGSRQEESIVFSLVDKVQPLEIGRREHDSKGAGAEDDDIGVERAKIRANHLIKGGHLVASYK